MADEPDSPESESQSDKGNQPEEPDQPDDKGQPEQDDPGQETDEHKPHLPEQQPHRPKATEEASAEDWLGTNKDPDVMLSVPDLGIDRINLTVEDLEAHVNLHAKVLDIVDLKVGAHVTIKKVELDIQNVHAQAMLKVNLQPVVEIVRELVEHPEILTKTVQALTSGGGVSDSQDDDDFDVNDTSMPGGPDQSDSRVIQGRVEESHEEADQPEDKPEGDESTQKPDDQPEPERKEEPDQGEQDQGTNQGNEDKRDE